MIQSGFYFDQSRCIGCHTCEVACKDWNEIPPGQPGWRKVQSTELDLSTGGLATATTRVEDFDNPYISYSCNHCEEPACMAVCPSGAIVKRSTDGVVLIDQDRCSSAKTCVTACPYGMPHLYTAPGSYEKANKCTMCYDRLAMGKQPACVAACIQRALDFGSLQALKAKYGSAVSTVTGFPADDRDQNGKPLARATKPSMLFKAK